MCSGVAVGEAGMRPGLYGSAAIRCGPGPEETLQQNQPQGVPPRPLTGERTLPDVPAENYWFRRHLAVYEWIAARVGGMRVIDMACGEGYGADLLGRSGAARVFGVGVNPEAD